MKIQPLLGPNGRLPILIRDDDINFFTKIDMLQSLYSEVWNNGFKVSFSVIPCQTGINSLCVPPQERCTGSSYSILDNRSLIKYLKRKMLEGSVEILQHGLHHTYDRSRRGEFGGTSSKSNAILEGKEILTQAFGKEPTFFVPPGEDISANNLRLLPELGMIPIYRNTSFDKFLRSRYLPNMAKKISFKIFMDMYSKLYSEESFLSLMKPVSLSPMKGFIEWSLPSGKFINLKTNENLLRLSRDTIKSCSISRRPICILNHYHTYFYDWNSTITKNELFRAWLEILRSFRELDFLWKVDFMNLYERFIKVRKVKISHSGSKITIKSQEEITEFSFLSSSEIEQNSIAKYDKETKICTIENILPGTQTAIYLKG